MISRMILPVVLVIMLAAGGLLVARHAAVARGQTAGAEEQEVAVPVSVTRAELGEVENSFVVTGTVEADSEVGVYSKVPGKLLRVHFDEGDWVPRGALVAELERQEILAQVRQAEAAVKAAEVRARQARAAYKLQTAKTDTSVEQAEAALAAACARLAQAETGVRLTDEDVSATIAAAEEAVRMAQARLDALRAGARRQEKDIARQQAEQAKANMETARKNLERGRKLLEAQAISQQQFDSLKLAYDVAAAQYKAALQQVSLVDEGPRAEEIRAAEAQLAQAKAQLERARAMKLQMELRQRDIDAAREGVRQAEAALRLARAARISDTITAEDIKAADAAVQQAKASLAYARTQLRNTYIYAPAAGYVVRRNVEPGEMVGPAVPIVNLVDNTTVTIKCPLSEERRRLVAVGQSVQVTIDALPDRTFAGRVHVIGAAASPKARAFEMQVRVPNPKRLLKSGMFARVRIVYKRQQDVVVIPYDAVVRGEQRAHVFVVQGRRARLRTVALGLREGDRVAVTSGIAPGELVVVRGQTELQDGQLVEVENERGEAR